MVEKSAVRGRLGRRAFGREPRPGELWGPGIHQMSNNDKLFISTFKESYKNMNVWLKQMEDNTGPEKLQKLARFCQTRWSSRARALRKLFGSFNDDTKELFSDLLMVLQHVNETPNFKGSIRYEAKCLRENLSKFETVLVAFIYIRIFDITTSVSDYLQTPGLDVLQAWRIINEATDKLSKVDSLSIKNYITRLRVLVLTGLRK